MEKLSPEIMQMILSDIKEPISEMIRLCHVNKMFNVHVNKFIEIEYKKAFKGIEKTERELQKILKKFKNHECECIEVSAWGNELCVDTYEREAEVVFVTDEQLPEKREGIYLLIAKKEGNEKMRFIDLFNRRDLLKE